MSGEPFALYETTWWTYIGCGVLLLALVAWRIRSWPFYAQSGLLTLLAAGAFSFTQVPNADSLAPAAIAFILELENEGNEGELAMLTLLASVWLVLFGATVAAKFGWHKWQQGKQAASEDKQEPEVS